MKILVTGSKGTIGRRLAEELSRRGAEVHGCDLAHDEDEYGTHFENPSSYQRCDVGSYRQIAGLIDRVQPELVYHTAAEFGRWNGEDFYERLWQTNAIGTKHILSLQAARRFQLVHFSSSEVYGDTEGPMAETIPIGRMLNDYAMSKWVNEQQVTNSGLMHGTQSVIVRLFNTYGPGERYSPYRSVNVQFLYRVLKKLPLFVHLGHVRTSTYVDDTVRTLANIAERFAPGAVFNIAGNEAHTMEDLAQAAMVAMEQEVPIEWLPQETFTTVKKIPDIKRAISELGHVSTVNLQEGMKLTADWLRTEYA